jgi:thiol-disulfide isomerase/thioredoxin
MSRTASGRRDRIVGRLIASIDLRRTTALTLGMAAALVLVTSSKPALTRAVETASLAPVLAASNWLNGHPTADSLRGKVVLVDVFTFGCYNCQNVTPNLRKLHASESGGLAIVGIHSPETSYEHDRSHVVEALRAQGITWPVAIDNDMALWRSYGIEYWPTQLIFDRKGHLRKTVIGDSQDDAVDETIHTLLAEK